MKEIIRRGRSNQDVIVESVVGLTVGIFVGSIFKSVGKVAISTLGGGFVTISTLAQLGYIKIDWRKAETLFHIEDFESSKFLSLIGEDTIISQIGPPSLVQNDDSKSSNFLEFSLDMGPMSEEKVDGYQTNYFVV